MKDKEAKKQVLEEIYKLAIKSMAKKKKKKEETEDLDEILEAKEA